jgi:hypothetical protein
MYILSIGGETHEFDERMDAIEAAKEMTENSRKEAEIVDEAGKESLTYLRGTLDRYVYETRPDRRR